PRRPQDLAEARVDQRVGDHDGGLLRCRRGRRGGYDVHDRADHGDGRGGPVREQLGDAGQVRVLQRQARQLAVHRHQLTQDHVLPAEITRWPGWRGPARGGEVVRHKRSIRPESAMVLVASSQTPGRRDRGGRPREPAGILTTGGPAAHISGELPDPERLDIPPPADGGPREGGLDCSSTGISTRVAACCHRRRRTRSRWPTRPPRRSWVPPRPPRTTTSTSRCARPGRPSTPVPGRAPTGPSGQRPWTGWPRRWRTGPGTPLAW